MGTKYVVGGSGFGKGSRLKKGSRSYAVARRMACGTGRPLYGAMVVGRTAPWCGHCTTHGRALRGRFKESYKAGSRNVTSMKEGTGSGKVQVQGSYRMAAGTSGFWHRGVPMASCPRGSMPAQHPIAYQPILRRGRPVCCSSCAVRTMGGASAAPGFAVGWLVNAGTSCAPTLPERDDTAPSGRDNTVPV